MTFVSLCKILHPIHYLLVITPMTDFKIIIISDLTTWKKGFRIIKNRFACFTKKILLSDKNLKYMCIHILINKRNPSYKLVNIKVHQFYQEVFLNNFNLKWNLMRFLDNLNDKIFRSFLFFIFGFCLNISGNTISCVI